MISITLYSVALGDDILGVNTMTQSLNTYGGEICMVDLCHREYPQHSCLLKKQYKDLQQSNSLLSVLT